MHNIDITMEKTIRVAETFEIPDSVYEEILRTRRIPDEYFDIMEKNCNDEVGEVEFDYAVDDDDIGKELIGWG